MSNLIAPQFTSRTPIQFIVPDNTALNVTGATAMFNNPKAFYIQPGAVAKVDFAINGTTQFRGDGEFSPFGIQLDWQQMAYTDYQKLAALRPYFVHFISHRNLGYYGKLVMDGPKSDVVTADVVSTKGTFFVLSPSDQGGAAAVNRVPTPTAATLSGPPATPAQPTVTPTGTTGSSTYSYIVIATNANGDSAQSTARTITNGNATLNGTNYNAVSWTAVSGATSYTLLRNGFKIASGSATSVNDTGLGASTYTPTNAGYQVAGTTNYYWLTFSSKWGETTPYYIGSASSGGGSSKTSISWAWPTSAFCTKASVYCANTNDVTQTKLMAEVLNGTTAVWNDVVGYAGISLPGVLLYQQPPTSNTAYRGQWQQGIWFNETP